MFLSLLIKVVSNAPVVLVAVVVILPRVAVDVKDVTLAVDVTMIDTVLSAMVELDAIWPIPTLIINYA